MIVKTIYQALKITLFGARFPIGISVDVTYRCNLRCKHCYFLQQNYQKELNDKDALTRIEEIKIKYPSIIHASWVGGEPLLRKNIIEKGIRLFPFNMIVTNGTIELPKWKNCVFNVSVDGTKEYYEKIRGSGIYDKVKRNANRNDIAVNIACVLNKENYHCIEEMLEEWKKTKVGGINFGFYTPIRGIKENLWLNWQERDRIINQLLKLKRKYGSFLLNPESVLKLMFSKKAKKITTHCLLPKAVICLDPTGQRKLPCVIGEKADCSRCGCVIPYFLESGLVRRETTWFFVSKRAFF